MEIGCKNEILLVAMRKYNVLNKTSGCISSSQVQQSYKTVIHATIAKTFIFSK